MEAKERYYIALKENKGRLNEFELGEKIGLDEEEVSQIIIILLSEHKITYANHNACNYTIMKRSRKEPSWNST